MESPSLRLAETSERGRIHQNAIRKSLLLVQPNGLCYLDAKRVGDKKSGTFAEPLVVSGNLGIYNKDRLPDPESSLLDTVAALHRSMKSPDCPIPVDVIGETEKAKVRLEKELTRLQQQFATTAPGHTISSEIDHTGLVLRHIHSMRDQYNHSRTHTDITITAPIGPILYWVQQNQDALNEYLETGIMPSLEKQVEYRLRNFKVGLLSLAVLIKKGLLDHGIDLGKVPSTDTTLVFQRRDVVCEGRRIGGDSIHCMIDEWLQCLTRIVELEPDFLPEEWQEPFLISRGKVVKPKAPEVGYRDLATPKPGRENLDYLTTRFYGVHILQWTLSPQNRHLFKQQRAETVLPPISKSEPNVVRRFIARVLKVIG